LLWSISLDHVHFNTICGVWLTHVPCLCVACYWKVRALHLTVVTLRAPVVLQLRLTARRTIHRTLFSPLHTLIQLWITTSMSTVTAVSVQLPPPSVLLLVLSWRRTPILYAREVRVPVVAGGPCAVQSQKKDVAPLASVSGRVLGLAAMASRNLEAFVY